MPLKSKAQGRFLNWKFGHQWVKKHHFGGKQGGLPERVKAQQGLSRVPSPSQRNSPPNRGSQLFRQRLRHR